MPTYCIYLAGWTKMFSCPTGSHQINMVSLFEPPMRSMITTRRQGGPCITFVSCQSPNSAIRTHLTDCWNDILTTTNRIRSVMRERMWRALTVGQYFIIHHLLTPPRSSGGFSTTKSLRNPDSRCLTACQAHIHRQESLRLDILQSRGALMWRSANDRDGRDGGDG